MPRIPRIGKSIAVGALIGVLATPQVVAQSLAVEEIFATTRSIARLEGAEGHLELRSAGLGKVPGIQFEFRGAVASWAFFANEGGGPPRFEGVADAVYLLPTPGADLPLLVENGGLTLSGDNPSLRYLADADDDDAIANHIWYENKVGEPGDPIDFRMMQLTQESGGTLYVDGPVVQNHTFDLAETFWETEPIAPGELVAIDPLRPNSVLRASGAYQGTLLGVASTSPGFLLGGAPFSLDELERTWGRTVVDEYLRERPSLELALFSEMPELESRAQRVASVGSYSAYVAQVGSASSSFGADEDPSFGPRQELDASSLRASYETAHHDFETTLFDLTLRRFFSERFSAVALAGRVPVKVDAAFGAIAPGDYLTSSPVPGVAMRASGPGPVIGTALEAHAGSEGVIEVFVHRGWYGGEGANVAGATLTSRSPKPDPRDRKIADLERRLALLESALAELIGPQATVRVTAQ